MKSLMRALAVTLAIFLLTAFGGSSNTLHMAVKPMTEQYILGSMLKKLIEAETDLKVDVSAGIGGGTANIQPAMEKGDFDFYPEYTGTGWNMVLKKQGVYSDDKFPELQKGYADLGMTWLGMTGFNNTFGLAASKAAAQKYNLSKFSDLAPVADKLAFGAEYDFFERQDGYQALCDVYKLKFKDTRDMDIGLKYAALKQGQIDVINIFTTDGQLDSADLVVLKDDKGLYPSYACGFVIRNTVLQKHPELKAVFAKMNGLISDMDMAKMNNQVESGDKEPEEVAEAFLKARGLIK